MINDNQYEISATVKFPSVLDPYSEKVTKAFGTAVGSAITTEWFHRSGATGKSRFYTSQQEFIERRKYAAGEVDMKKYYPKLGTNGDTSLLNLSAKSITPIPKIVDLVVNGMCDRGYSIEASAIDPISQDNKQNYRKRIQDDMNSIPIIQKAKETFGMDISSMPIDQLPQSNDELDLHLQMNWKPSCELSAQIAIKHVFDENMFDLTTDRIIKRDLIVDGAACIENRFHPAKGVTIEPIDFKDMVYSRTKDPYFRDCFYKGCMKRVLISDVFLEFPSLRNAENEHIAKQLMGQAAWWNEYQGLGAQLKGHAYLLYFTYKTTKEEFNKIKEKANGEKVVTPADATFDESKLKKGQKVEFKRVSKVEEVMFEGVMILGTNILLKWELAKSMARPNSDKQKVCEQYNMIAPNFEDGKITSLVTRMMPIVDNLNVIELKAEQIIQGITPDGIAIDLDAIAQIEFADGSKSDHNTQLNMYLQKGSFFYRSSTLGGEYNNAQQPFKEIRTGDSINKLTALRNESLNYLTQLTDIIGLNKATDASTPDKDSLVGIQKLAALNSNLATRHILKGAGYITLKTAEPVLYRVQDILKYYPSLREGLIRKIGATTVEDIAYIGNLYLSDFALNLYLEQDDEEKALLDQDLSLAIEKGFITLADKYKVKNIRIFKQAIAYLAIVIEKASKKQQEIDANKFKQQADENIRASQQAEQFKQQTAQMLNEFEAIKQKAIADGEIAKEKARGEQDRLTLAEKIKGDIEVQLLMNSGATEKLNKMQSDKEKNLAAAATHTSRIADQKAKEKDPIDFEGEKAEMEIFNS
jgi:hypothetical protein